MAYVTKLYNGSQTLTIRDPEAIHGESGSGPFNPAADIAFTGADSFSQSPTVPTVTPATDSTTKAASTAFVQAAIAAAGGGGGTVTVDHHYPIVDKSAATSPYQLDDRSVNILSLGSATTATITMPAAVDGKARDLWLILTCTTSETKTYTLAGDGCTFYGEESSSFQVEVGENYPNVFVFTEFSSGKFAVSRRRFATQSSMIH